MVEENEPIHQETPQSEIEKNETQGSREEGGNDRNEKSPKRQKNDTIYHLQHLFKSHEPPAKTQYQTSKLTLEAQNKEGVDILNQTTKNLTQADSNKEGISWNISKNEKMDAKNYTCPTQTHTEQI